MEQTRHSGRSARPEQDWWSDLTTDPSTPETLIGVSSSPPPLFRPDIFRTHLAAFELPAGFDAFRLKLKHWADLLVSASLRSSTHPNIKGRWPPRGQVRRPALKQAARPENGPDGAWSLDLLDSPAPSAKCLAVVAKGVEKVATPICRRMGFENVLPLEYNGRTPRETLPSRRCFLT